MPLPPSHIDRTTSTASSSAARAPAAGRGRPPNDRTPSGAVPQPRPSSTRPPLSTSSDAIVLASTTGGRSGRQATAGNTRIRLAAASTVAIRAGASRHRPSYGRSAIPSRSRPSRSAR
nr:hypothetical protein [Actinomadura sp. NBRC 104412]